MMTNIKPGDMLLPVPGRISYPGVVVINAVYDQVPLSEVTDEFNTLRDYKRLHLLTGAGEGIKVGVADTGVDRLHLDGDLKGCIAKDFTRSHIGYYDAVSHGTHTTGHIGARGDNSGFIGLAPKCELYHAKVLGDDGSGSTPGIAAGINWLVEQGCKIINLSLGGGYSRQIDDACNDAAKAGVLVFASMGNSGNRGGGHPGTSKYTFGITAVDYNKKVAGFSSRDTMARYTGYGVQVLSLVTNGKLGRMSGTSMSCPDQAGLAANILSYMNKLSLPLPDMGGYASLVEDSVEDLGTPGHDNQYGLGFIDIWKVIKQLDEQTQPPISQPSPPPVKPDPPQADGQFTTGLVMTDDGIILFSNAGHEATITIKDRTYKGRASYMIPSNQHNECNH